MPRDPPAKPAHRPLRAIPVPAGMDPEQRIKFAEEAAERGGLRAAHGQAVQERDCLAAEFRRCAELSWWRRLFA